MASMAEQVREWGEFATQPAKETGSFQTALGLVPQGGAHLRSSSARIRVDTEELGRLSASLAGAASRMLALEGRLVLMVAEAAAVWTFVSEHVGAAAEALGEARRGSHGVALGAGEYSAKLRIARASYEHAEELAEILVQGFDAVHSVPYRTLYGSAFAVGGNPLGLLTGAAGFVVAEGTLLAVDSASRGTAAAVRSSLAGSGLPLENLRSEVAAVKARRRSAGLGLVRLSGFRKVGEKAISQARHGGSLEFVAQALEQAGRHDDEFDAAAGPQDEVSLAHVDVTEVTRPDGTRSFLISIPGTDFDHLTSRTDPDGAFSIADVATTTPGTPLAQSPALLQLVERSLVHAGVGRNDPVLLSGFSQGGMAAMALASNREFTSKFTVRGVVTTGAPTAPYTGISPDIRLLHVRDVNDPIPVATGGGGDPGNDHAVVVHTNVGSGGLMQFTHGSREYVRAGRSADDALATTHEGRVHAQLLADMMPKGSSLRTTTFESGSETYDAFTGEPKKRER
ncbi:hypothetical protein [Kocuria massiliensis]|uniref:hypothetical protein n=1 Tax=Kocuria massiliensis TaxID=1926282 RepID=UPI000A1CD82A|nr:hypothetical protein [Kocuria massiliensis]